MARLYRGFAVFVLCVTLAHASFAASPTNQVTLNDCQKTVKAEGAKFIKAEVAAISTCLQKIAMEKIRNNAAIDNAAARTCITQFRKLYDTRGAGKSLREKLAAKIQKKCEPIPAVNHTINDITGKGIPTVPQPINTQQIDLWCANFGGDGSIDSVTEWIDCIVAAHQCEAEQAIAEQYPRAPEWLSDAPFQVKSLMGLIPPPASDPTKISDAMAGLTAVHDAIDSNGDNLPDLIACGHVAPPPVCSTACCYIEGQAGSLRPTACFQYKGSSDQVTTFKTQCQGKKDGTGTQWDLNAADGACSAGVLYGKTCVVGGAENNAVAVPTDSACP